MEYDIYKRIDALPDINYPNWKNQIKGYVKAMYFLDMPERYLPFVITHVNRSTHLYTLLLDTDLGNLIDEYHENYSSTEGLNGEIFEMREVFEIPSIGWTQNLDDEYPEPYLYVDMDKILIFTSAIDLESNKPVWRYDF